MLKTVVGLARVFALGSALCAVGNARVATAINLDFEGPTYAVGTLLGQDGWATNGYVTADPFFGGTTNGTVNVSASNPLAGIQSVLYNQTAIPPGAGNTGASDVGKAAAIVGNEHGTSAIDLTASFLIQTNDNAVGAANNGSMGFFLGQGGRSPIILLLVNAGPTTGDILIGDAGGLPDKGDFKGDDVLEITIGVDLDGQNYDVSVRNVTAGTPLTALTGSGPGGRFPFFGGTITDDGNGVSYTLDTSLLLRSGVGRIDAINVVTIPEPATAGLALATLVASGLCRRRSQ